MSDFGNPVFSGAGGNPRGTELAGRHSLLRRGGQNTMPWRNRRTKSLLRFMLLFWFFLVPALYIQMDRETWKHKMEKSEQRKTAFEAAEMLVVSGFSLNANSALLEDDKAQTLADNEQVLVAKWGADMGTGKDDDITRAERAVENRVAREPRYSDSTGNDGHASTTAPVGRVALCITGHLRSFRNDSVHTSIYNNVYTVLRNSASDVDVFFHVNGDDLPKPAFERARNYSVEDSNAAMDTFKPVSITRFTNAPELVKWPAGREECLNKRRPIFEEYPAALVRASQCMGHIKSYEKSNNIRYSWVYKTRPDISVGDPISDPSKLRRDIIYVNQHTPGTSVHAHPWLRAKFGSNATLQPVGDQIMIASRELADVGLAAAHRAVLQCDLYDMPNGTLNSEVALSFWLARNGVRYKTMPWFWMLVRAVEGPECSRVKWIGDETDSLMERCLSYKETGRIPTRVPQSPRMARKILV